MLRSDAAELLYRHALGVVQGLVAVDIRHATTRVGWGRFVEEATLFAISVGPLYSDRSLKD